ncbi:DUF982 domain-containing protein [Sinorhizobium meliloti]|uniref:DUF982 domain-containing protein n=1 Tax=Rhizobium meliloti TaxID=382 RepID=UPI000FDB99C0|nr:DUF982 domain-containing protein [Sinorhizobium meliloti]MDE3795797.1 DUF982 domain-containing protein [Sinorhizobium meliloti]RVK58270.1 DUF982 domain-containing protein [Sinorhizobium meliloti]
MRRDQSPPDLSWCKPLTVRLPSGLLHTFITVFESLDFLENEWPLRTGPHHDRAVQLCQDALAGRVPPPVASVALLAAATEVGMQVVTIDPPRRRRRDCAD